MLSKANHNAIIFDLDRTLINIADIEYLLDEAAEETDYLDFHLASRDAPAVAWIKVLVNYTRQLGIGAIAITARNEIYRDLTVEWFALNGVTMDDMYMRPREDYRPDHEVKKDQLAIVRAQWNPMHAFDDREDVLQMWESEGIGGTLVAPNGEETPSDLFEHLEVINAVVAHQNQKLMNTAVR